MPRLARCTFSKTPHHVTQRGNRGGDVFFTGDDREAYLEWLAAYAKKHDIEVLAYCLMTNHIHLVVIPADEDGLHRLLKPLHMRYAQRVNRSHGWTGHLWQGRFFSSVLDEDYLWAAIRYVERNPVRAKIVRRAENYRWSSAKAHCGLQSDSVLTQRAYWKQQFKSIGDWAGWLAERDEPEERDILRRNAYKNLPCGSDNFIRRLEKRVGRTLQYRPRGRPKVENDDGKDSKKG